MTRLHEDELPIDESLVRKLLSRDVPGFGSAPLLEIVDSGSTNRVFRVGDGHAVRLPRQPGGSVGIDAELRWTPSFARSLPVAVPEIVAVGEPGFGYPERWSVTTWLPGHVPSRRNNRRLARELAELVRAVRATPVTGEARQDVTLRSYRGGSLAAADRSFRDYVAQCRSLPGLDIDLDACERLWDAALAEHDAPADPMWLHGDLLAENLLVDDEGRLSAVLDLGAVAVGDPTVDLVVGWDVLDAPARSELRDRLDVDEQTWLRARAWAVLLGLMTFPYYGRTMPVRCRRRRELVSAALADPGFDFT